jgi:hypothetical protein
MVPGATGILADDTKLHILDLTSTNVTDAGLGQLKSLMHLKTIYLPGAKVTSVGVADIHKALPRLEIER